ncbi:MAG: 6-carboxytetrahydropterin synthase [Nitrospinae bacterium]|nr:6-carboxytetrahydropterin synthase [Nitrospinota bacterium]
MYEVTVKTRFSAAHQLRYYDGKYENLHGHNWTAIVTVQAEELDAIGVGIDFVELKKKTDSILSRIDYQNINQIPPFDRQNPSAENVARWLYKELGEAVNKESVRVRRVEVREIEECGAIYYE